MPTGGGGGSPGHLVPTGGSIDPEYIRRGLEQAQAVVNDTADVKPMVTAYTRRVVSPAARAAYEAAAPLANEVAGRGHEGMKLWESVDDLRSLPGAVGEQLVRSFSGEDASVPPERSTAKTLEDLAGLRKRLATLSWKSPGKLQEALGKIAELEAALQWEEIAAKVVR